MPSLLDLLTTPSAFAVLLAMFVIGSVGALAWSKHNRLANLWSHALAISGALWGMLFASAILVSGNSVVIKASGVHFPLASPSFNIDALAAFFILIICLVVLFSSIFGIGYVKHYYGRYNIGSLGFFYNSFIVAMILVVSASNALMFLIAWEIMSLSSYFLVVYERSAKANVRAGYIYLVMTQAGTAFIVMAFALLYVYTKSFDFAAIQAAAHVLPSVVKNVIFLLACVGFGTKAGIIPLHIWLPEAHPAAPSHVSALMSGVMIKTGIYMMIRLFLGMLLPVPLWWGIALLVVGSISSLMGVLYALTEHDIKRLLAYHSIENIGIILLGVGSALVFSALHLPALMLLALAAALFHTLNHAVFKSLLFLSAGSVIQATHTRNMEDYGGLIKVMPLTALFFLVGSMAISALPPLNGFYSEWLTYQALFQGIFSANYLARWTFVAAAAALALTGGLAIACFVKAFGISFLARPRSDAAKQATEVSRWMLTAMAGLAGLCLLIGFGSARIAVGLQDVARGLTATTTTPGLASVSPNQSLRLGFGSVSAPAILLTLVVTILVVTVAARYGVYRKQQITRSRTWDCGTDLSPRMEITSSGFANSLVMIFRGLLKPTLQYETDYDDSASRYMPRSRSVSLSHGDIYRKYIYRPIYAALSQLSQWFKYIQNGNINSYILYIFIALLITLVVGT